MHALQCNQGRTTILLPLHILYHQIIVRLHVEAGTIWFSIGQTFKEFEHIRKVLPIMADRNVSTIQIKGDFRLASARSHPINGIVEPTVEVTSRIILTGSKGVAFYHVGKFGLIFINGKQR